MISTKALKSVIKEYMGPLRVNLDCFTDPGSEPWDELSLLGTKMKKNFQWR